MLTLLPGAGTMIPDIEIYTSFLFLFIDFP